MTALLGLVAMLGGPVLPVLVVHRWARRVRRTPPTPERPLVVEGATAVGFLVGWVLFVVGVLVLCYLAVVGS